MTELTPTIASTTLANPTAVSVDIEAALTSGSRNAGPMLTRDQILDAAVACLEDGGYDGLTIRKLAQRLGCAVGTMYRYFSDKHELLVQCGRRLLKPVLAELKDRSTDFDASVAKYVEAAESDPELYQIMFWLPRRAGRTGMPGVVQQIIDEWAALLGDATEARKRFAMIHGQVTLGDLVSTDFEQPTERAESQPQPVAEPEPAFVAEPNPVDDVTLL